VPILVVNAPAVYTDGLGNGWGGGVDWSGFGTVNEYVDGTGYLSPAYRDTNGLPWLVSDNLAERVRTFFDGLGNPTKIVLPDDSVIGAQWDDFSDLLQFTDPNNHPTNYGYDNYGNVTSVTDALGKTWNYYYDNTAQHHRLLTLTTDPLGAQGQQRQYYYDNLDRLTKTADSVGNSVTQQYDNAGNVTSVTDQRGKTTTYTYDNVGRVKTMTTPDGGTPHPVWQYDYDPAGATAGYGYDNANRLTLATETIGSTLAAQVGFNYDDANRLLGVTRTTGGATSITTGYNYDIADRVTQITESSSAMGPLATFAYGYDNANRVTSTTDTLGSDPAHTRNYSYDDRNQLTGVTGWHPESYGYDNNGNRNTNGNTPGTGNRQQSDGTYNYQYDNEGNVTLQTAIAGTQTGWTWTYTWDYRNRLTEAVVKNASGQTVHDDRFVYDVNDQRIGKSVDGTLTWTAYDDANAFADFNGAGALLYHYLYGLGTDTILAQVDASGTTAFYLTDKLGSVRQLVTIGGVILEQLYYDSFGNILPESSVMAGDRFKYTAREYDAELGVYYYRARYYQPTTGRFLNEDPSGLGPDVNPYRYVGNHPTYATDPTGLIDPAGEATLRGTTVEGSFVHAIETGNIDKLRFLLWLAANDPEVHATVSVVTVAAAAKMVQDADARAARAVPAAPPAPPPSIWSVYTATISGAWAGWRGHEIASSNAKAKKIGVFGEKGAQTPSKTMWKGKGKERIDVENPNPGQRPGQIHYQDNQGNKYLYDPEKDSFPEAPKRVNDMLKDPAFRNGIIKALRLLGEGG
jgi:RHS repeat-associated protein